LKKRGVRVDTQKCPSEQERLKNRSKPWNGTKRKKKQEGGREKKWKGPQAQKGTVFTSTDRAHTQPLGERDQKTPTKPGEKSGTSTGKKGKITRKKKDKKSLTREQIFKKWKGARGRETARAGPGGKNHWGGENTKL